MAKITSRILVIDLEGTCWDSLPPNGPNGKPMESEIIEIGICELSRQNRQNSWEIVGSESILVRPRFSTVSSFCTELTTLTQEKLENEGIDFFSACKRLEDIYNSRKSGWASWGDYDRLMFERQCRRASPDFRGQNWVRYPFSDTHWNMKAFYSLLRKLDREVGMAEALKLEGLKLLGTHHRGVDDAINTARILQRILP